MRRVGEYRGSDLRARRRKFSSSPRGGLQKMMTGYGFKDKTNTKPQPNKYEGVPESSHLTSRGRAKTWYGAKTENVVRSRLRSVRRGYETFARLRKGFDDTERSSETKTGL